MLPEVQMVKARKAIESLYDGVCTITASEECENEDGSTGMQNRVICEEQPCKLSYGTTKTREGDAAAEVSQSIKLLLAPELVVPPGCRIVVTQQNVTRQYTRSGISAAYATHQEINLELKERWA